MTENISFSQAEPTTGFDPVTGTDDLPDFAMALDQAIRETFTSSVHLDNVPAFNDQFRVSHSDFDNSLLEVSNSSNGYPSSSALPENLVDFFDDLTLNPSTLSNTNLDGRNFESIVSLDGSEIQHISSTTSPCLASMINYQSSLADVFDSELDATMASIDFDGSLALLSGSGSESNSQHQPGISDDLHSTSATQTVQKPYFQKYWLKFG